MQNASDYDQNDAGHRTASLAVGPSHGTLSDYVDGGGNHPLLVDGSFSYTPAPGFYGTDTFTFNVTDGLETSGPYTVSINVMENPPQDQGYNFSTTHDQPISVGPSGVLQNAYDYDQNDAGHLTASLAVGPSHGTLSDYVDGGGNHPLLVDGSFLYTPAPGFYGTDTFTFNVTDGLETSGPYTVSINVMENPPQDQGYNFSTTHDQPISVGPSGVLQNAYDYDQNDAGHLTAAVAGGPSHGTLSDYVDGGGNHPLLVDGSFLYTPAPGFYGTDTFTFNVNDGLETSGPYTVSINVAENPPQDQGYYFNTTHDQSISVGPSGVLQNAYDYDYNDASHLTAAVASGPSHGTLGDYVDGNQVDHPLLVDGSFDYTPATGFFGQVSFTFTVSDGVESSQPYTVTIYVAESAPQDQNYNYSVLHDHTLIINPAGVLQDASDYDAPDTGHLTASLVSGPSHGALSDYIDQSGVDHPLLVDGSFDYTPSQGYVGGDQFVFAVSDGLESTNWTVSVGVFDDPPSGNPDSYTAVYDTALAVPAGAGVLINDGDPDSDPITSVIYAQPSHGSLTLGADGSFTYTPADGYEGQDSFEYEDDDGIENGQLVMVAINVVHPRADIDVDSNNDGYINFADDPTSDPAFEERDPGKVIIYNDDDDNRNGTADRNDPTPFKDSQGNLAVDNELVPGLIAYAANGANLAGFTLSLDISAGSDKVKLWSTPSKEELLSSKTWTIGTDIVPDGIFVEGYAVGGATVDLVLKNPQGAEIDRDKVRVTVVTVTAVTFNPSKSDAEVTHDNPDGQGGTPSFGGGWRAFPDAQSFADRNNSHNVVRVEATLSPAIPNVTVYFASYDVDDPSQDMNIDPNGNAGGDNRGTFAISGYSKPGPSQIDSGDTGALRAMGGDWQGEPAFTVTDANGVASMDFATTFAPGDNFRLTASVNGEWVNQLGDIPTTGAVIVPGGAATDQLAVWRHFNVEQDLMATTQGDQQSGNITGSQVANQQVTVATDIDVAAANQYEGGILRAGGVNYPIIGNTAGANATVTITGTAALANGPVTLYDDDWTASGNAAPTTRIDTQSDADVYDYMQPTTVRAENRFADAYLQPDLHSLDQFDSANDGVYLAANTHVDGSTGAGVDAAIGNARGTSAAGSETDLFWVVYVATAFQSEMNLDNDPSSEPANRGVTNTDFQSSLLFLETIRDSFATEHAPNVPSEAVQRARTGVHEVGHQFFTFANMAPGGHRDTVPNLMHSDTTFETDAQFYFAPEEIAKLRLRVSSP